MNCKNDLIVDKFFTNFLVNLLVELLDKMIY